MSESDRQDESNPQLTEDVHVREIQSESVIDGSKAERIESVDGDIHVCMSASGEYTDLGSEQEQAVLSDLKSRPWRDVVRDRFESSQPWLYRIITSPRRIACLDLLTIENGHRVLDVGSGWGQISIPLSRICEVHALDQTVPRLRILREIARQEQAPLHYHCGDIRTYPFRDQSFDCIILNGVLEYLARGAAESPFDAQLSAIRRIRRLLKPDGRLFIAIENAIGLKYVLGTPDDHSGLPGTSIQFDPPAELPGHTWALDQYLDMFGQAGFAVEKSVACFPDYKLVDQVIDVENIDDRLRDARFAIPEHSGADGTLAIGHDRLNDLYRILGRLGVGRYFVPSYAFVLRNSNGAAPISDDDTSTIVESLAKAGLVTAANRGRLTILRHKPPVYRRRPGAPVRFHVEELGRVIATVKTIPMDGRFDVEAIRAAYAWHANGREYRPVRLLGEHIADNRLFLVEEFLHNTRTLDDMVERGIASPEDATLRMVRVADDMWRLGEASDSELLEKELAAIRPGFNAVIESPRMRDQLYCAFRDMMLAKAAEFRTVLSTRDLIGRNLLFGPADECFLIDFDLAHRTMLFCLDVARNLIHVPYCTQRLFDAVTFNGLDRELIAVAAAAAEYQLQSAMQPGFAAGALRETFQTAVIKTLAPRSAARLAAADQTVTLIRQIDVMREESQRLRGNEAIYLAKQHELLGEIEKARVFQSNLLQEIALLNERTAESTIEQGEQLRAGRRAAEPDRELEPAALSPHADAPAPPGLRAITNKRPPMEHEKLKQPCIDLMAVSYNSRRWLDGFIHSLTRMDYPAESLRLVVVDNGSTDDSVAFLRQAAATLPFEVEVVETAKNLGFAGGHNVGFLHGRSDFYFVVNLDTEIEPDTLNKLMRTMAGDPKVGIAEARQSPHEHPKYFDAVNGETSWCSGACMMIRAEALREIGGGFDDQFFMYAEDVDLSWRMWLHGWKCVYVRDALIQHYTESLNPDKPPKFQHYFMMRNGALMRAMYGTKKEILIHYLAMLRLVFISGNPGWHRWLTFKSILTSLKRLPRALNRRKSIRPRMPHPWVFFDGWQYGREMLDFALGANENTQCVLDVTGSPGAVTRRLAVDLPVEGHISHQSRLAINGAVHSAFLVFDTAELEFEAVVPPKARLMGYVAAPPDTWRNKGAGRFDVLQDGVIIQSMHLSLDQAEHRAWVAFDVPLPAPEIGQKSRIVLRFHGERNLVWGLWGGVRVYTEIVDQTVLPPSQTAPAISVVMPTHNRATGVARVIHRLMSQDIDPAFYEVIVVDSNSRDDTPRQLADLCKRYPNMTAVRCEKPGAAAARNMGIEQATAPLVLLLDDDILVAPNLLKRLIDSHRRNPNCILLGNIIAPWQGATDPFHRYLQEAQDVNIYDFEDDSNVPPNYFYTACVAIPRSILGGTRFDEGFQVYGVEDIEFGFRLLTSDVRMIYLRNAKVWHEYYPEFEEYARKKRRAGYSLGYFLKTHPQHAHRFVFETQVIRHHRLLSLACGLGWPLAKLLSLGERIRRTTGPINRLLFRWYYSSLRIKLFKGVREFGNQSAIP